MDPSTLRHIQIVAPLTNSMKQNRLITAIGLVTDWGDGLMLTDCRAAGELGNLSSPSKSGHFEGTALE